MTLLSAQWAAFQLSSAPYAGPDEHAALVARILGVARPTVVPITIVSEWTEDTVDVSEVSWNVGFGPDTHGWFYRPRTDDAVPGILGLHSNGGD